MSEPASLIDVREDETFLGDERDVKAALVSSRRFAQGDDVTPDTPFATVEEANEAADAIKGLKVVIGAANEHRLEITAPYRVTTELVNGQYKELLSTADTAVGVLTKRGLATKRREEEKAREEERRRREELQKREEEAAEKAAKAARAAEDRPDDAAAQKAAAEAHRHAATAAVATQQRQGEDAKPKQLRGAFASLGSTTTYKWDVFDLEALPDKHKTFNKKTIDAAVKGEKAMAKAEGREFNLQLIPGVRIWTEERGVSR
jgi:pyruvate/2-oxoglutarate dehydrogenase complex dihydrolipoamide acyltransferase (E2) component